MNYHRFIIAIAVVLSVLTVSGQNTDGGEDFLLSSIERNNTTLIALRTEAEARKLENRTGITLADPEVGYKHMWEGGEESGNLSELTVTQSIDLATVMGQRTRVAREQNLLIDEEYRMARMEILLDAQLTLVDLAYYNALAAELDRRLGHARRVVEAERTRLESGDTDALSHNNVLLSLSALEAEEARIEMERSVLIARLTALNGGVTLDNLESLDALENLESLDNIDFSSWYAEAEAHLPQLAQARQMSELRSGELALAKASHLPSLSATYINERHTVGTRSQGVAVGVSIPLWANKNRVRSARTALQAAEAQQTDAELQLRSAFEQEFTRVKGLHHTAMLYRRALDEANNTALLEKAMDEGYISVLEYLQGIELYYDYLDSSLSADRDYHRALATLEAWRL
jgi:outer membrane protein TolC